MKSIALYTTDFLEIKEDESAIKENISRILTTLPGERVNNPTFGSKIREYLFQIDVILQEEIEGEIYKSIRLWEPRVTISNVRTEKRDERTFVIFISGEMKETLEPFTYDQIIRL